jgi:hypothetical protein
MDIFYFYNGMPHGIEKPNSRIMEKPYKEMIELVTQ